MRAGFSRGAKLTDAARPRGVAFSNPVPSNAAQKVPLALQVFRGPLDIARGFMRA
jgi:hypothetical protein